MPYTDSWLNKVMREGCGGFGFVVCWCGGDLCVCGLDGEACPGCDECKGDFDDWQAELDEAQDEYIQEARSH